MRPAILTLSAALVILAGCSQNRQGPDLRFLYNRAAQFHGPDRNPVIAIPGIMGSKLRDQPSGQVVWGAFGGDAADPDKPDGARLLALPMRQGSDLRELTDAVSPDGALDRFRVRLLGLPIMLQAYANVMKTLGVGGYRDEDVKFGDIDYGEDHFTCFQFAYDWRRGVAENAARLHEFIEEKRVYLAAEYQKRYGLENPTIRFDIAAHSMGGLLTRYYLRYGAAPLPADGSVPAPTWAGAANIERVVLVGTPNAGSVKALVDLAHGRKFGPMLPKLQPAVIGTMPAVYQLLPRDRHGPLVDAQDPSQRIGSLFDPELWERNGWGLADPEQAEVLEILLPEVTDPAQRRRIALDHLRKSLAQARQLTRAMDQPAEPPPHLTLKLVAGDAESTPATAALEASGQLKIVGFGPGDGTVLRSSALLDERVGGEWQPRLVTPIHWSDVNFLFRDHLGMTQDPHFTDNVLFFLLEGN